METSRSEWEEDKELTAYWVRSTYLNNLNSLITSGIWCNKDYKDVHIIALVRLAQKLADNSKKSYEKYNTSNRDSTKGEPACIRHLPPCNLEEPKMEW